MVQESFPGAPNALEEKILELTSTIRDAYGKHYDDLSPDDQTLWNELFRFANVEKNQSEDQRKVLAESLASFLSFLKSEYDPKD